MSKHIVSFLSSLFVASTVAASASVMPNLTRHRQAQADHWADSVYAALTERQRMPAVFLR